MKQILRETKLNDAQRLAVRLSSQMAAINAQVEEGIVILTADGAIDEINPAAAQMLGYRSEDISGLSYSDVLIADVHIMDAILAGLSGSVGVTLQGNIFRRGGQAFPASIRIQPLPEYGCVITLHDDSEEHASRVRREHLDNLAYVGQSTQAFAHEVRGPLNNICLGVQYLQSRLKEADDPLREALAKILTEGNRLSTLMNEMLAWAKPVDPHFELLDPTQLLERLLNRWHSKIQQRNVHVTFVADEDCPPVLADALHLERICVNLIDNALQAMPAGGDLSIRVQAPPAATTAAEQQILIQVGDTGPGIPDDIRRRVFDPYFTTKLNGTGLGLAICRRLVTVNRGAISVESFPGTGTIFTVTLPASRTAELPNNEATLP
jgi:two-component system nitrogen regulation sensor histidine kinase GlnL